jgi:hypothetical protein
MKAAALEIEGSSSTVAANTGTGNSTSVSSGAVVPTGDALYVGWFGDNGGPSITPTWGGAAQHWIHSYYEGRVLRGAGSKTATWTLGVSDNWAACIAAFAEPTSNVEFRPTNGILRTDYAASASPVITKPTGVADGDVLLMFCETNSNAITYNTPVAGWAQVGAAVTTGDSTTALYWKLASGEGTNWTMTSLTGSAVDGCVVVLAYIGGHQTTPINTSAETNTTSDTLAGPSITPTVNGCMIVQLAACDPSAGGTTFTADASPAATKRYEVTDAGNIAFMAIQDYLQASKTAISLDMVTTVSDGYGHHQVAIAPAVGGGGGGAAGQIWPTITL